jgi:CRP/FNR family transcriptional regulator, cyclic AMP receptor protein
MKIQGATAPTATLLAGLTEPDTRAVTAMATSRTVSAGTALCRQGEPAEWVFLLLSGRARFGRTTAQGRDVLLRRLGAGECFGLASFVPGPVNYMATAVTTGETALLAWDAATIRAAATAYPKLSENAFRIALEYLEEFAERHVALLSQSAEQRVARTITHLGATAGRVLPSGVEVDISNHDLASLADVGMFTVSRQLKRWEREGHLLKTRQKVVIRHPEALFAE